MVKISSEKKIVINVYSPEFIQLLKERNIPFELWDIKSIKENEAETEETYHFFPVTEILYKKLLSIADAFNLSLEKCIIKLLERDIEFIKLNTRARIFEEIIQYYETEVNQEKLYKVFTGEN